MSSEVQIIGQDRINAMLQELNDIDSNKSIKAGIRKGLNILKQGGLRRLKASMKNPAGVTGNLIKAFNVRVKKNKLGGLAGFGMVSDMDGNHIIARHAHLVDLGTAERERQNGGSTGKMPALHFWTDTRNEDMDRAVDAVLEGTEQAILKMMSK